jgi:hypothetical protein
VGIHWTISVTRRSVKNRYLVSNPGAGLSRAHSPIESEKKASIMDVLSPALDKRCPLPVVYCKRIPARKKPAHNTSKDSLADAAGW